MLTQFPMRLGLEVELRRRAPAARFHVILGRLSHRDTFVRKVRKGGQNVPQAGIRFDRLSFALLDLLAQFLGFLDRRGGILTVLLQFRDFFGSPVAPRLQRFGLGDSLPPFSVNHTEILQNLGSIHAALAQLFLHQRKVFTDKIQIKHSL